MHNSPNCPSAIDHQVVTGNERTRVRCQEDDRAFEVVGLAPAARGESTKFAERIQLPASRVKLEQAYKTLPFKAFLMGHVKEQHVGVRLSKATELSPASFKVFEVLLLMLARLAEEADRMKAIPLGGILFRAFGFRYRTVVWS